MREQTFANQPNVRVRVQPAAWSAWIGGALLLAAFGVGYAARLYGSFGDEGDNLAVAQLLMHGRVLYRDVFSHHFPFAYYWLAAVFTLFGPSIAAARLSLLCFQMLAFAAAMAVSRLYVAVGAAALVWNSVAYLYYGNIFLYQAFGSIALVPMFLLALTMTLRLRQPRRAEVIVTGIFAACGMLTNPLLCFPIAIALGFALAARYSIWRIALLISVIALIIGIYAAYLVLTHTLVDFYANTVTFNNLYYAKYSDAVRGEYGTPIVAAFVRALYVFDADKVMYPIDLLANYSSVYQWLLASTFYRLTLIGCTLLLLAQRRWLAGAFVYCFAATLLLRGRTNFDAIPTVITALCAMATVASTMVAAVPARRIARAGGALAVCVLLGLAGFGSFFLVEQRAQLSYTANFDQYEQEAAQLKQLTCGQPALLGYYPGNPYMYFFSDLPPVSKYLFLWPWVAEIGQQPVVEVLQQNPSAVVHFDTDGKVWGFANTQYLKRIYTLVKQQYVEKEQNIYVSPRLQELCRRATP